MLGEGFRGGLEYLGIRHRSCCYVEREAYAASVLVARMEEGSLDEAPIWADVTTFDARAWRGKVDCIVAGFPCQDLSVAGRRAGLDGKRSGLFFEVVRIATDSGARLIFLENVAGIASATATVMDETEGELDERAAARVVGELADCGWDAEWITISASDVGASHGRARWFCIAWRERLGDPSSARFEESRLIGERELSTETGTGLHDRPELTGAQLAATNGGRRWSQSNEKQQSSGFDRCCIPLFAPGPSDTRWGDIIASEPWRSPALSIEGQHVAQIAYKEAQSVLFRMADGDAAGLDFGNQKERLKCVGNGVVPEQAAIAFVLLARRAGLA